MFASLSGIIGKPEDKVAESLRNYALSVGGDLTGKDPGFEHDNFCAIEETNGNTTIIYPHGYLEWDQSSAFLSRELQTPVFSFHIHDGDLWMYILYVNGEAVDQFNPIPDYWDEDISSDEMERWKGNASVLAHHIPALDQATIEKYLTRWDLEAEASKAYEEDEYVNEDWQLVDFMKKIGLSYPLEDFEHPRGRFYTLWTKQIRLQPSTKSASSLPPIQKSDPQKPWWKFW